MKRDRSMTVRGAHVDELIKKGLSEDDVRKIVNESTPTTNIPTGALPQPTTPYLVASSVANDGKIQVAVGFTTIAPNLKRFHITHRLRRKDGFYGKPRRQTVPVTPAMIAAGSGGAATVILDQTWNANRQVDLLLIEGKFVSSPQDDGGGSSQFPDPYVEVAAPPPPKLIASFLTGAGQTDQQQINEALNSKFKFGQAVWGDTNGAGTHDDHRLARWRFGAVGLFGWNIDTSIGDQTTGDVTTNYWSSAVHINPGSGTSVPAGVLVLRSSADNKDPCVKLHQDPFDPGEPCVVQFCMFKPLARGSFPTSQITITIEDGGTNQVLCSSVISLLAIAGVSIPTTSWFTVRTNPMTIRSDYVPVAGAGQICRFHIDQDAVNGIIMVDKVMASSMSGAYSANPRDRMVDGAPTVPSRSGGFGRGPQGFGTTGGESNTGGQIIRMSTE